MQEMLEMSLACMELQQEQWSHSKGKTGMLACVDSITIFAKCKNFLLWLFLYEVFLLSPPRSVSPRWGGTAPGSEPGDAEFPGPHFQKDLFVLALGASQMDLFGDAWFDAMVRVHWLKARFLALQVKDCVRLLLSSIIIITHLYSCS